MSFRTCHLFIGGLGLLLFALQGQYMARVLGVIDLPDAARMMYRSAHIYLLLACVANVGVGYYMKPAVTLNLLQRLISVVLLLAPGLLIWSFFTESTAADLERPAAQTALYLLFGSATLLVVHGLFRHVRRADKD